MTTHRSNRHACLSRICTLVVSLTTSLSALPAVASPGTEPAAARAEPGPHHAESEARRLFDRGFAAYRDGDLATAARLWTTAHDHMAGEPQLVGARRVLGFDLGQVHVRLYEEDSDPKRLRVAKRLLEDYVQWVDRPEHLLTPSEQEDRPRAVELLVRIAVLQDVRPIASPGVPAPVVAQTRTSDSPRRPRGTGMLVGGSLSLLAMVGFSATAILADAGMKRHASTFEEFVEQKRKNEALLIGSATAAFFTGAAGIALLAVGGTRRRRWLEVTPTLSSTSTGLRVGGRF